MPQVLAAVDLHISWGSLAPLATLVQVPWDAGKSQVLQASSHRELQQTPWAQLPDLHSLPPLHSAPFGN
jgi:hypothetical protein